jgi:hypothetical protein
VATIKDEEVELEARAIVRERIECTPWFRKGFTGPQRQKAIEREVDRCWILFVKDAAARLVERRMHELANEKTRRKAGL